MTIGITFPVQGSKTIKSVPWGVVEQHRMRALRNHGMTLERLYATGGLSVMALARVLTDADPGSEMTAKQAAAIVAAHAGQPAKENADAK